MTGLDIFALIVLIVLIVCGLAAWVMLAMYPGIIARQRSHPQAEAINVCGWWGAITMGLLTPVAFIWAYTNSSANLPGREKPITTAEDKDVPAGDRETTK